MSNADNIRKYLDISTAHIPTDERKHVLDCTLSTKHDFGFWVWVPTDDNFGMEDIVAECPSVAAVIAVARELGCTWINFDADADTLDGLPTFDESAQCHVGGCDKDPRTGEEFCPGHMPSVPIDDPGHAGNKKCVKCQQLIQKPVLARSMPERCENCAD